MSGAKSLPPGVQDAAKNAAIDPVAAGAVRVVLCDPWGERSEFRDVAVGDETVRGLAGFLETDWDYEDGCLDDGWYGIVLSNPAGTLTFRNLPCNVMIPGEEASLFEGAPKGGMDAVMHCLSRTGDFERIRSLLRPDG